MLVTFLGWHETIWGFEVAKFNAWGNFYVPLPGVSLKKQGSGIGLSSKTLSDLQVLRTQNSIIGVIFSPAPWGVIREGQISVIFRRWYTICRFRSHWIQFQIFELPSPFIMPSQHLWMRIIFPDRYVCTKFSSQSTTVRVHGGTAYITVAKMSSFSADLFHVDQGCMKSGGKRTSPFPLKKSSNIKFSWKIISVQLKFLKSWGPFFSFVR